MIWQQDSNKKGLAAWEWAHVMRHAILLNIGMEVAMNNLDVGKLAIPVVL